MIKTITKSEFERVLPVGMSSNDNVFEMVLPEVENQLSIFNAGLFGDVGAKMIDAVGTDGILYYNYIRMVVSAAFVAVMRQLDLVLTPTGFGVVSNDNVSPASKQRVDALEGQLRKSEYVSRAIVLMLLRSEEWGETQQAVANIPYMFDEYDFFVIQRNRMSGDVDEWLKIQQLIRDADRHLRMKISDSQMDVLMSAYRKSGDYMSDYQSIISYIKDFHYDWCFGSQTDAMGYPLRKIISTMENPDAAELYGNYLKSEAYKLNHHETIKNTKDSSAFFFNG